MVTIKITTKNKCIRKRVYVIFIHGTSEKYLGSLGSRVT